MFDFIYLFPILWLCKSEGEENWQQKTEFQFLVFKKWTKYESEENGM